MNNFFQAPRNWVFLVVVVVLILMVIVGWLKRDWLIGKINVKNVIKEEVATLISHNLGPIAPGCLNLPQTVNPYEGNTGYSIGKASNELDIFSYAGKINSFSVETFEQEGNKCQYYVVELTRGNLTAKIYLPWNLKSMPSTTNTEIGNSDGQILQQFKGQMVNLTIQYQVKDKERKNRQFFMWKAEVK
ncbi:hypothetical protein A2160_03270 [Candidatus Beckwithbacteria bacterium RBG_13_42_9]|uniref:Uncharacterized protein n=1 Tax=Candidatus Beckwithbacteria bacterium RBG_13_42_9 TaxID=1797457 RepID=A0A1F5E9A4_9BACT|nr:MAG: hypothetical protein A2160_03270 [Candidatus Beckwithbacteria bacterium RBG_13_42_9]